MSPASFGPTGSISVVQHYRERVPYVGWNGIWLKPEEVLPLRSGPLFRDTTERWLLFRPREGMAESYLIVTAGVDTMRIDLPEQQTLLWQQAMQRGTRDTPEVIRFRKGSYIIERLMVDPWAVRAAQILSTRLMREDQQEYERSLREQATLQRAQERERTAPSAQPPPPRTAEEIQQEIAARPGLRKVVVTRVSADTVWVRITGRVMLDGGCASNRPLFGIEILTESGWVERHALGNVQMDCGAGWGDWTGHEVMLPSLRTWVDVHSPAGRKELLPGTYRLVLMGANMERVRTKAFALQ